LHPAVLLIPISASIFLYFSSKISTFQNLYSFTPQYAAPVYIFVQLRGRSVFPPIPFSFRTPVFHHPIPLLVSFIHSSVHISFIFFSFLFTHSVKL
jgi:hypothetical protein